MTGYVLCLFPPPSKSSASAVPEEGWHSIHTHFTSLASIPVCLWLIFSPLFQKGRHWSCFAFKVFCQGKWNRNFYNEAFRGSPSCENQMCHNSSGMEAATDSGWNPWFQLLQQQCCSEVKVTLKVFLMDNLTCFKKCSSPSSSIKLNGLIQLVLCQVVLPTGAGG